MCKQEEERMVGFNCEWFSTCNSSQTYVAEVSHVCYILISGSRGGTEDHVYVDEETRERKEAQREGRTWDFWIKVRISFYNCNNYGTK